MDQTRYSRQTKLADFGSDAQRRLGKARVLVVGLGGLGCASAQYLAMAGVGFLRLLDGDVASPSDLNRQILYGERDIGEAKVKAAEARLRVVNSEVEVEAWNQFLGPANLREAIEGIDLIVDGTDSLAPRRLINRAYSTAHIPVIFAGASGYAGYVMACANGSACFDCVWTEPPASTCDEAGILGPVVGTFGAIQASEAIKLLTGIGDPLTNRLLLFDGLRAEPKTVRVRRRPDCPTCVRT